MRPLKTTKRSDYKIVVCPHETRVSSTISNSPSIDIKLPTYQTWVGEKETGKSLYQGYIWYQLDFELHVFTNTEGVMSVTQS